MSKPDVSSILLRFLNKENRPFSVNEIFERCGKEFGRAAVQKALDSLKAKDKIVGKCFGKHIVYHAKQSNDLMEIKKKIQVCAQKLAQAQHNMKSKTTELCEAELKLKTLTNVRSVSELEGERENVAKEICELNEKLQRCETKAVPVKITPAAAQKIEKDYENAISSYRKRKRICHDMLDAIQEGLSKPKKRLIEEIGLDTDEDAGFKIET